MQAVRSVDSGGKFYQLPPDKENTAGLPKIQQWDLCTAFQEPNFNSEIGSITSRCKEMSPRSSHKGKKRAQDKDVAPTLMRFWERVFRGRYYRGIVLIIFLFNAHFNLFTSLFEHKMGKVFWTCLCKEGHSV